MKTWKLKTYAIMAVAALLVATAVWGDNNALNHVTYYQNATNGAKTDANGNAYVTEAVPPGSAYLLVPSAISAILVPAPDAQQQLGLWENRDSTQIFDCRGYNRCALMLFPSPTAVSGEPGGGSSDSIGAQVLALEVRAHTSATADSQSTFIWREDVRPPLLSVGQPTDTLGSLFDAVGFTRESGRATGIRTRVLPYERAVVITNIRNNNGTAAGTGTGEGRGRVIFINKPAAAGGLGLPPFMSFRIRSVATYISVLGGAFTGAAATDSTKDLPMRVRCDVVFWRE